MVDASPGARNGRDPRFGSREPLSEPLTRLADFPPSIPPPAASVCRWGVE